MKKPLNSLPIINHGENFPLTTKNEILLAYGLHIGQTNLLYNPFNFHLFSAERKKGLHANIRNRKRVTPSTFYRNIHLH